MKELSLVSKLVSYKNKHNDEKPKFSRTQMEIIESFRKKYDLTETEINEFITFIGKFIDLHTENDKIVHIQQFGKFIPYEYSENKKIRKKRGTHLDPKP